METILFRVRNGFHRNSFRVNGHTYRVCYLLSMETFLFRVGNSFHGKYFRRSGLPIGLIGT